MYYKKRLPIFKLLNSKVFFLLLTAIILLVGTSLGKELYRRYLINKEINNLKAEIKRLEDKNLAAGQLIDYLKTGDFAEREARLKFGLQKPGENVTVVLNKQKVTPEDNTNNQEPTNRQKWFNYFLGQ